jgi:transposase
VRTPAQRREALLDEFEKSGLSGTKFAAFCGIKYQTFANWVQQRRRKQAQPSAAKPEHKTESISWLEAVVPEARSQVGSNCGSLILHLPGGVRAELASTREVSLAAALLRELQKPC